MSEAFEVVKKKEESPILANSPMNMSFILDTDASNFTIGAVLSLVQNGKARVIAYFSKTLRETKMNHCVTNP